MTDPEIVELARTPRPGTWGRRGNAGARYVRTPEGSKKYGLPMGARITRDAELRAKARGRSYNVPEDDSTFGSQAPAAGRTRRTAQEIVSAIRNAPAPRRVTPDGPKKIAVGQSGFGFPEGSRTFRPRDHQNFAIVRTPDYQLVVATDKGVAFELDGDLENELNEELDDDASENFDADEPADPNQLADVDGDGETGQSQDALDTTARPARVEDSPGFLNEDRIQDILSGMEQSGLDQNTRDMAELQLRRNNDRIRQEYDAAAQTDAAGGDDGGDEPPASPEAAKPEDADAERQTLETVPQPVPERQPEMPDEQATPNDTTPSDTTPAEKPEGQAQATPERPATSTATAEKPRRRASSSEGRGGSQTSRATRSPRDSSRGGRRSTRRSSSNPDVPAENEEASTDEQLATLEELARNRPNGVAEGEISGKRVSIRRNRVNDAMEYSVDGDEAQDRADVLSRAEAPEEGRDTTGLSAEEMTDDEIENVLADITDLLTAGAISRRSARHRREELRAEQARRNGESEDTDEADAETPPAPTERNLDPIESVDDLPLAERENILEARPGDRFVARDGSGSQSTWFVDDDGRVRNVNYPDDRGLDPQDFAAFEDSGWSIWADSGNESNQNERTVEPGDVATRSWAGSAKPGAAAYGSDGVIAERNEDGEWETPMGVVSEDFFTASDVENDDQPSVVRNEADEDGRPVGATNELLDPEDVRDVRVGDGLTFTRDDIPNFYAERRRDGDFNVTFPDGTSFVIPAENILGDGSARAWHVPNRDLADRIGRKSPKEGDLIQSLDNLLRLPAGSTVERRRRGRSKAIYTQREGGVWVNERGQGFPTRRFKDPIRDGEMFVGTIAADDADAPEERTVTDPADYQTGDKISSHRHLRDMNPGQQVTLVIPSSRNGGQEAHVVLTRTNDETSLGGFMFLVGNAGRGYNSFGENNADLYQALHEGRVLFGNITDLDGTERQRPEGNWSRERNIEAWDGGPQVSEYDLRQYLAAQMTAQAMQKSYFDPELVAEDSPFRSQEFRLAFAKKAKDKYSERNNPVRSKPASIRMAAELLGLQYTDPGSTLLPDDLEMEDFRRQVRIGRTWYASGALAEGHNMGLEELDVSAADVKTALAILDNMLESDNLDDPDKILKRVFARQGSPLQQMNVAVAVAAYFQMQRLGPDGTPINNRPARQDDKRRNAELLRQMLREQLEGREPGYYGIPEDHEYTMTHRRSAHYGQQITLHSQLGGSSDNPERADDLNAFQAEIDAESDDAMAEQGLTPEATPGNQSWDSLDAFQAERTSGMSEDRLNELDDFDTVQSAYVSAVRNGDPLPYIQEVLGEAGVAELNDGSTTMRRQFTRAWNQRNGVSDETPSVTPDAPAESGNEAPASTVSAGDSVSAAQLADLRPGTQIVYTRRSDGRDSTYTLGDDNQWRTNAGTVVDPNNWSRAQFRVGSVPGTAEPSTDAAQAGDASATSRFRQGDAFRGSDIREVPVGAHIIGQSGREYRVTETGITSLGGTYQSTYDFDLVARNNANFTFVSDTAPEQSDTALGQTAPDPRIGTRVDAGNLMDYPEGALFRSSGGTAWRRQGRMLVSQNSGQRRHISRLSGTYRYLGTGPASAVSTPTGRARAALPSLESAGLTRTPQSAIERFDRPRPMPEVVFDQSNTAPWAEYLETPQGQTDLLNTLKAALPEGSNVGMRAGASGFSAQYRTPDGATGSMTRSMRGPRRIENAVAHAGGANFMAVQDQLFAFYRQHGIEEVEVHGLSSRGWNGAHTWIRRGARPDPNHESENFNTFNRLRENLDRIIRRTQNGDFPQYQEFLEEAQDLSRRMLDLYTNRTNMAQDERLDQLYRLWRELTYLGEVRDANGKTARGRRESIGWALLGDRSSGAWYYGVWPLDRYFEEGVS